MNLGGTFPPVPSAICSHACYPSYILAEAKTTVQTESSAGKEELLAEYPILARQLYFRITQRKVSMIAENRV